MRMPFGKHKDMELEHVPRPYLRWLRRQPWLGAWLVREIDAELSGETTDSPDDPFEGSLGRWRQQNAENEEDSP